MELKPKKWTHHHVERLYHLSMLTSFVFIILVIIYGISVTFWQASADQASGQAGINVTATVANIQEGPVVIQPAILPSNKIALAPNEPLLQNDETNTTEQSNPLSPKVTIATVVGTSVQEVKLSNGHTVNLPSFGSINPTFTGTTNIKNAIVFLEVHSYQVIRATTYADSAGHWSWTCSESIEPGAHTLYITAQDPQTPAIAAKSQIDFYSQGTGVYNPKFKNDSSALTIPDNSSGNLFDALVVIPEQFKSVSPGSQVVANIKLINFGSAGNPVDVTVEYVIEDSQGKVILRSSQTVAVATQLSILKTFNLDQGLPVGTYKLTARVPSKDIIATSADTFEVKGQPILQISNFGKVDFTVVFQVLFGLLFLFCLIVYFEYYKVSNLSSNIKKVDEQDLNAYNKN